METKEFILPDGWEVKEVKDNKIILAEKEKELPRTWGECLLSLEYGEYIHTNSDIRDTNRLCSMTPESYNIIPKGLGKPMLALCQLLVCRNAWWKQLEWEPEWGCDKPFKWCIHNEGNSIGVTSHSKFSRILAFPTYDIASQFLTAFRDLIEEAKELL